MCNPITGQLQAYRDMKGLSKPETTQWSTEAHRGGESTAAPLEWIELSVAHVSTFFPNFC
jgi:hypothetical protein